MVPLACLRHSPAAIIPVNQACNSELAQPALQFKKGTMRKKMDHRDSGDQPTNRRDHARVQVRSVIYVELDEANGGLVTNISEGGIAVQCAGPIAEERFSEMRFRLPGSETWIVACGQLIWLGESKKEAGIQFCELNDESRQQIAQWVSMAVFGAAAGSERGGSQVLFEAPPVQASTSRAAEPEPASEDSEMDAMFPSEKSLPSAKGNGSRRSNGREADSSFDIGILSGRLRRDTPSMEPQSPWNLSPNLSEPETSELDADPAAGSIAHSHVRNRDSWQEHSYPSPDSAPVPSLDPFAPAKPESTVIKSSRVTPPPERARAPEIVFPLSGQYRTLSYHPPPFEEPSGKGWLFAGAALAVVLTVGGVMAIGPANVKALGAHYITTASQYISSARHRETASNAGPPPPASALENTPSPEGSGLSNSSNEASNPLPLGNAPQASPPNPAVGNPESPASQTGGAAKAPETSGSQEAATTAPREAPRRPQPEVSTAARRDLDSYESPESSEAITRRFQLEHSQASNASQWPPSFPSNPAPQAAVPPVLGKTDGVTQSENQRTLDAYSEPASSTFRPLTPAPSHTAPTFGASLPAGTVAISSHFYSLRGEDPQDTQARQGLMIGQLLSIHQPVYPVEAERARVEGTVRVRATVDQIGRVTVVQAISGPPMLIAAAVDAVREWRYGPTISDARAVESVEDITVAFHLGSSVASPR